MKGPASFPGLPGLSCVVMCWKLSAGFEGGFLGSAEICFLGLRLLGRLWDFDFGA